MWNLATHGRSEDLKRRKNKKRSSIPKSGFQNGDQRGIQRQQRRGIHKGEEIPDFVPRSERGPGAPPAAALVELGARPAPPQRRRALDLLVRNAEAVRSGDHQWRQEISPAQSRSGGAESQVQAGVFGHELAPALRNSGRSSVHGGSGQRAQVSVHRRDNSDRGERGRGDEPGLPAGPPVAPGQRAPAPAQVQRAKRPEVPAPGSAAQLPGLEVAADRFRQAPLRRGQRIARLPQAGHGRRRRRPERRGGQARRGRSGSAEGCHAMDPSHGGSAAQRERHRCAQVRQVRAGGAAGPHGDRGEEQHPRGCARDKLHALRGV